MNHPAVEMSGKMLMPNYKMSSCHPAFVPWSDSTFSEHVFLASVVHNIIEMLMCWLAKKNYQIIMIWNDGLQYPKESARPVKREALTRATNSCLVAPTRRGGVHLSN